MLEAMRLSDLLKPLTASLSGADSRFTSVSIDARSVEPGGLFVALPGSRSDGHDFVEQALERGAAAAMVERQVDVALPQLLVHDCQLALGRLGALAREAFTGTVIGVTGSSGKTTVKEMLAAILSQCGPTLATVGNLNNELGVPLTLLQLQPEHRFAVVEMGAAQIGDIQYSMSLAKPQISVLTNAEMAHVGRFGSPEKIARAKGEIVRGLPDNGQAVLNLDSPWFESWYQLLSGHRSALPFSMKNPTAQIRAESVVLDEQGCAAFNLVTPAGQVSVELKLRGQHNVANALAASAAAIAAGADLTAIARGLAAVQPVPGRGDWHLGLAGAQIIDDSYNANPASVKAAIDLLAGLPGKRLLVLGDMGELGEWAEQSHREMGVYAREKGLDAFYALGKLAALGAAAFGAQGWLFDSRDALLQALQTELDASTRVLVKGSRSAGMDLVVAALVAPTEISRNDHRAS